MNFHRTFLGLIAAAGFAVASDPALINLMMRDPKIVAGVDVQRAKDSPFGQKIIAEIKEEDPGFQKLLEATGFDPRRDLREVVFSSNGEHRSAGETVIAVSGTFDTARIARYLQSENSLSTNYKGFDVWQGRKQGEQDAPKVDHKGAIAFLNGTTAVLGTLEGVQAAIDRRLGQAPSGLDAAVATKVAEWSAGNDAWFVSNTTFLAQSGTPNPGYSMLPQGVPIQSMQKAYAGVKFGANVDVTGEAVMRSPEDANALVDVVRFIVGMIRLNQDKPGADEIGKVAETIRVSAAGTSMKFSMTLPEEQLQRILDGTRNRRENRGARKAEVI